MDKLFQFVIATCEKFNIDESHGLSHSMKVLQHAHHIYMSELTPELETHKKIIYLSAVLHDMCDKKYMSEEEGFTLISDFIKDDVTEEELSIIHKIITTMSYSKVKALGFPDLGKYQLAYHIVREADLLSAYDIDRCIIYRIHKSGQFNYEEAYTLANVRILKQLEDGLFLTNYSKKMAQKLHSDLCENLITWKSILKN